MIKLSVWSLGEILDSGDILMTGCSLSGQSGVLLPLVDVLKVGEGWVQCWRHPGHSRPLEIPERSLITFVSLFDVSHKLLLTRLLLFPHPNGDLGLTSAKGLGRIVDPVFDG